MHPQSNPRGHPAPIETEYDQMLRTRATDHAQTRLRRVITLLAEAREHLTTVVESGAHPDVKDAAEAARDQLDNTDQEAAGALRIAVDASGMVEIRERPVAVAAE